MGLNDIATKEQRAKRTKLVVRAAKDPGPEGDIARAKVADMDAANAEKADRQRGKKPKVVVEPVLTDEEKKQYALTTVGPLQQALAAATAAGDISAIKDVAAMATALRAGARARGMGIVSENQAAEVVIRAERTIGSILASIPREKTGPAKDVKGTLGSTSKDSPTSFEAAVMEAGLNRKTSWQFQLLARLTDEEFEALLARKQHDTERIARVDFVRAATPVEPQDTPVARQARKDIVEALHADDDIPQVVAWLAATDRLLTLTDAIPTEELQAVGLKTKELVGWYNQQKAQRS